MRITWIYHAAYSLLLLLLTACGGGEVNDESYLAIQKTTLTQQRDSEKINFRSGQGNISVNSSFQITFNNDLDETFLNSSNIVLHNMNSHKQVKAKIEYDSVSRTVTLVPASLEYDNHYMIDIIETIVSIDGQQMRIKPELSFFTESKPALYLQVPENNETEVSSRATVRVSFEKPMNAATINSNSFYITDSNGVRTQGLVKMTDNTAVFTPSVELALNTRYYAVLSNTVQEAGGFPFSFNDTTWSFTTKATRSSTLHIASPGSDSVSNMVLDTLNNMIVVGSTDSQLGSELNRGNHDAYIAKFNSNHDMLWITQFGTDQFDTVTHIITDSQNDIYILGYTDGSIDGVTTPVMSDNFVAKYNAAGIQQWITQFGAEKGHEESKGITILNNKLYVAGSTDGTFSGQNSNGEHDYFVAEIDMQSGTKNWVEQHGTTGNDHAAGLALDELGHLILSVNTMNFDEGKNTFEPEMYVKIYAYTPGNTGLQLAWEEELRTEFLGYHLKGLTTVGNNIYVSGERHLVFSPLSPPPPPDIFEREGSFVAKFDASLGGSVNGVKVWDKSFDKDNFNVADTIAVDQSENIYLAGFVYGEPTPFPGAGPGKIFPPEHTMNISVRKYNSEVTKLWTAQIKSTDHAVINQLALDNQGTLHLAGDAHGGVEGNSLIGEADGFVAKINAENGQIQ